MADTQNNFGDLNHSGLLRANSKDNKDVTLSIDVWNGNTSVAVFTGSGTKPWKETLPEQTRHNIAALLRKMIHEPKAVREAIGFQKWDPDKKNWKPVGQMGFGLDDNLNFFIDIAHNDLNGRHLFYVKSDHPKFDFSNTSRTEKDGLVATINWLINVLVNEAGLAERLTAFKRPGGNQGGVNRSYGNKGGGYNNNNNNRSQNQGSFSGPDSENDLTF